MCSIDCSLQLQLAWLLINQYFKYLFRNRIKALTLLAVIYKNTIAAQCTQYGNIHFQCYYSYISSITAKMKTTMLYNSVTNTFNCKKNHTISCISTKTTNEYFPVKTQTWNYFTHLKDVLCVLYNTKCSLISFTRLF